MSYVNFKSSLIGKKMCNISFEEENNTVLVAIARNGEVVQGSPREIELQAGDTLLLECPNGFKISEELQQDMMEIENESLYKPGMKTLYSSLIMIAMVVVSTMGWMTLLQASFTAAMAMIICKFCSIKQARESIDWSLLMIFAGSISLGTAIEETGIAEWISGGILTLCEGNPYIALIGVCTVAVFLTEFASNTATAAIFFPIAYQTAVTLNVNPLTFCVALMVAVSSGYAAPIGSPTHMLVYGPGGYRFSDFFKIGIPLDIIMLIANICITLLLFPF
jgi:di/tricarboxylate transporter